MLSSNYSPRPRSSSSAYGASFRAVLLFAVVASLASTVSAFSAFTINIGASEKQCFYEILGKGDRLDLSFQVSDGGNLDIDFWISGPDEKVIHSIYHQSTSTFGFNSEMPGKYTYCFSNQMSSVTEKVVSFTVQGPDERLKAQAKSGDTSEAIAPLESEIRTLTDGLRAIRDEQSYLVARERTHRNTAESTNSRVVWWSIIQTFILVGVCAFQVLYLKRFFEVKRVV